tara:strand:+ start:3791 stop:4969 length:1179 start_codon:yes stop_codon:yes gene_type:complete
MYRQFAPSETKYGIIPAVKFDKHDSGASVEKIGTIQFNSSADLHGSIASVASTGKEIQYHRGDHVSVKKYHSLIKQFEYEESDSLFFEFEQMNAGFIDDEEREISFVRWQTLHLLSVGNNTRKIVGGQRTREKWNLLVKQRQEIVKAIFPGAGYEDELLKMEFPKIKEAAEKKGVGGDYFKGIRIRCKQMMKAMLSQEVELQQKLAMVEPQGAPPIYGFDDELFTIAMPKLESKLLTAYPKEIPDYIQYQLVALVHLFNKAGVKRNETNIRNYMTNGKRVYAINFGMDSPDNSLPNTVSSMFLNSNGNSLSRRKVYILRECLKDEQTFELNSRMGLDIMRFLDDGGKDLRHFIDYHSLLLQDRRNGLLKFYTQPPFTYDHKSDSHFKLQKPS